MQPALEAGAAVRADGMLAEVEPVLDGAAVPAPLPSPIQAHILAPAAHLPQQKQTFRVRATKWLGRPLCNGSVLAEQGLRGQL